MAFAGSTLKISGTALDNATIADYMETIVTSPYFGNAELSATSSKSVSGRVLKNFALTISVVNADYQENEAVEKQAQK